MRNLWNPFAVISVTSMRCIREHLAEQPVSDRTFSRFCERLYNYELETGRYFLEKEMMHLADVFAQYMGLNSGIRCMDSLMVASECKRMSWFEILYQTTANAVLLPHRLSREDLITNDLSYYF